MAKQEYVNFKEIEQYVNDLSVVCDNMNSVFESITTQIYKLPEAWVGNAGRNFYDKFTELQRNFIPAHEELMKAIVFLTTVGEGYDSLSNDLAKKYINELNLGYDGIPSSQVGTVVSEEEVVEGEVEEETPVIEIGEDSPVVENTLSEPVEVTPSVTPTPAPAPKPAPVPSNDTGVSEEAATAKEEPTSNNEINNDITYTESNKTGKDKLIEELQNLQAPGVPGSSTGSETKPNPTPVTPTPAPSPKPTTPVAPTPSPSSSETTNNKPIDEIARDVIRGDYGNGQERYDRLTDAGYDYYEVQGRVNEILRGGE